MSGLLICLFLCNRDKIKEELGVHPTGKRKLEPNGTDSNKDSRYLQKGPNRKQNLPQMVQIKSINTCGREPRPPGRESRAKASQPRRSSGGRRGDQVLKEGDGNLDGAGAQLPARCEPPFLPSVLLPGRAMSELARSQVPSELGYAIGRVSSQGTEHGRKQVGMDHREELAKETD